MDAGFWHEKWEKGDIGFHEGKENPLLVAHFHELQLPVGSRVLLPLCGKSLDIVWLLARGYKVVGVELSEIAIKALFDAIGLEPVVVQVGTLLHYSARNIDVFVGDIFDLSSDFIGEVDAIYDRAALVALPAEVRVEYAAHLVKLTHAAPQLLISYEYDQSLLAGPPFSVVEGEIAQVYGREYRMRCVARQQLVGGLKGKVAAIEAVWRLDQFAVAHI